MIDAEQKSYDAVRQESNFSNSSNALHDGSLGPPKASRLRQPKDSWKDKPYAPAGAGRRGGGKFED